jgi:capsule biosynthesis phosphatase
LVVDLDGTLTLDEAGVAYADKRPNAAVVARLREYRAAGFRIAISTARNMRTHQGNIGLINAQTLPGIVEWLARHDIPHDEIHVGKPWCGEGGFYVDDKAIRPSEFLRLDLAGIHALLAAEAGEGPGEDQ